MFSDLECDYINPIDLCNKLNQVTPLTHFSLTWIVVAYVSFFSVCPPREHRPRLLDNTFPGLWAMDSIPPKCTTTSI
jgi:hypothetical protein